MATAVFVKDGLGNYYRRSIWYKESRLSDAKAALDTYFEIESDLPFPIDPILCESEGIKGE